MVAQDIGSAGFASTLEDLRTLVHDLARRSSSAPDADGRTVLLDVEVDGVRCLFVRLRPGVRVTLSPRELEIARMVAEGYPNKTIAAVLDISSWTVGTHLRRIFAKLGVSRRAAMVARLARDDRDRPADLHDMATAAGATGR